MCDEYDGIMSISSVSFFSQQGTVVIKMIASYYSCFFSSSILDQSEICRRMECLRKYFNTSVNLRGGKSMSVLLNKAVSHERENFKQNFFRTMKH